MNGLFLHRLVLSLPLHLTLVRSWTGRGKWKGHKGAPKTEGRFRAVDPSFRATTPSELSTLPRLQGSLLPSPVVAAAL